jgi:hypothetical protein
VGLDLSSPHKSPRFFGECGDRSAKAVRAGRGFILGVPKPEDRAMHASTILRCCIGEALGGLHASRCHCVLGAVEALVAGRRLSLTELARQWPGADRVHAPLKALDRLLSNKHLHAESADLQRAMVARLLQGMRQPTLQVDWSSLKRDGCWALLRASVAMGGRAMPVHRAGVPDRAYEPARSAAAVPAAIG